MVICCLLNRLIDGLIKDFRKKTKGHKKTMKCRSYPLLTTEIKRRKTEILIRSSLVCGGREIGSILQIDNGLVELVRSVTEKIRCSKLLNSVLSLESCNMAKQERRCYRQAYVGLHWNRAEGNKQTDQSKVRR